MHEPLRNRSFLGAFAYSHKAPVSSVISVLLSTRTPMTTASIGRISVKFDIGDFCHENPNLVKIGQTRQVLYVET